MTDDEGHSLDHAVDAARFARGIGATVVLFKANTRERYIAAAGDFLDRTAGFDIVPVVQNHLGTPISTLADYEHVLNRVADPRLSTLLEVGHFHSAGIGWRGVCWQ